MFASDFSLTQSESPAVGEPPPAPSPGFEEEKEEEEEVKEKSPSAQVTSITHALFMEWKLIRAAFTAF